ncbi:MAG: branched-chain amino acid ABC transporter permease [Chthoniobacterales bacterium]
MLEFLQQLINGLAQGSIYALIALGYTMVFGVLRFINFAHGDVYMLGAFAGFYIGPKMLRLFGDQPGYGVLISMLLVTMILCALIGIGIEWLCYRPLRNRPKLTVLITAIGVSLFLENGGQFLFGADPKSFPEILTDRYISLPETWGRISELGIQLSAAISMLVTVILLFGLRHIVLHTKMGMAMRALSFNPVAASLMGINNSVVIAFTFGLGSALAGAAGILTSIQQPSIDPLMGISAGLKAFVAAVLGGIGNLPGAALGGILIGVIETMVVGYISPTYRDAIVFGVLILILLLKPTGLLGASEQEKV